jgi:hypothetical protein
MISIGINIFISHNIKRALRILNILKKFEEIYVSIFISKEISYHLKEKFSDYQVSEFYIKDIYGISLGTLISPEHEWIWNIEDNIALSEKIVNAIICKIKTAKENTNFIKINCNFNCNYSRIDLSRKKNVNFNARDFISISNQIIRPGSLKSLENPFRSISTRMVYFIIFLEQLSNNHEIEFCTIKIKSAKKALVDLTGESELLKSKYFIPSSFSKDEYIFSEKIIDNSILLLNEIKIILSNLATTSLTRKDALIIKSLIFSYIITSNISSKKKFMIGALYFKHWITK